MSTLAIGLSAMARVGAIIMIGASIGAAQTRQIVVLYDERPDLPGLAMLDAGFARALTSQLPDRVEIYREAMDLSRFDSEGYRRHLREHLRTKYAARGVDAIVAVMEPALDFVLSHRGEIFPGAPVVFCGIDRSRLSDRPLPSDVTGVLLKREFSPTLELAVRLHPETDRIVVVAGASEFDTRLLAQAREEFQRFEKRFTFSYLTALPLPAVLSQLSQLPPKTVVLYLTMFRDGAGEAFVPHEVAQRVSEVASVPVYGFVDQYLGRGIVGGCLYSLEAHGEKAAELVRLILSGKQPRDLPPMEAANSLTMFDWRQLQRWKMNTSQLPPGSEVRFHTTTLWEQYKWELLGICLILLSQTAIVAVLIRSRSRGKRLACELKENQSQLLQGRAELKDQLHFERLMTDISGAFMRVPAEEFGKQIVPALGQIAQFLGFDVATLALFTGKRALLPYVWHEPGTPGLPDNLTEKDFPWSARELFAGRDVHIRTLDDFPPEAQTDRATYERYGLKSTLDIPVFVSGQPVGVLSMGSFRKEQSVPPQLVERQRVLGNIFGNALVRTKSVIALRESEERMILATEAAQLGMWMWNIPANTIWLSDSLRELLGYTATEEITYETFLLRVHEEDRIDVDQAIQRALSHSDRYYCEYRVVRPNGTLRWFAGTGRVKADALGKRLMLLGVWMDITGRHRAEEESRQVSGKLITAQEDERKRIARDLHDDLNQRLALLSVQMEIFGIDSTDTSSSARERLEAMNAQVKELSSEVHRLSYELHPAKLDQLGLVVAARTFCREVSARAGVAILFEQQDVPRTLNADVALCVYRVIQEALQNSIRHGGGTAVTVKLSRNGEQIYLVVADEGKGFDVDYATNNGGLGLVSMRERARQVHGSMEILSRPGSGTQVKLAIPLKQAPRPHAA